MFGVNVLCSFPPPAGCSSAALHLFPTVFHYSCVAPGPGAVSSFLLRSLPLSPPSSVLRPPSRLMEIHSPVLMCCFHLDCSRAAAQKKKKDQHSRILASLVTSEERSRSPSLPAADKWLSGRLPELRHRVCLKADRDAPAFAQDSPDAAASCSVSPPLAAFHRRCSAGLM